MKFLEAKLSLWIHKYKCQPSSKDRISSLKQSLVIESGLQYAKAYGVFFSTKKMLPYYKLL